jgi:hypothetical protein
MSSQSGALECPTEGKRPKPKIKKSRKPEVATPSDNELMEDNISELVDSES